MYRINHNIVEALLEVEPDQSRREAYEAFCAPIIRQFEDLLQRIEKCEDLTENIYASQGNVDELDPRYLERDANLADIPNKEIARKNLGITDGESDLQYNCDHDLTFPDPTTFVADVSECSDEGCLFIFSCSQENGFRNPNIWFQAQAHWDGTNLRTDGSGLTWTYTESGGDYYNTISPVRDRTTKDILGSSEQILDMVISGGTYDVSVHAEYDDTSEEITFSVSNAVFNTFNQTYYTGSGGGSGGGGGGAVSSVFGRTGDVVAATNDYTWAQIDKSLSDIADIVSRSHTDLTDIGTNTHSQIDSHIASSANPHSVTAAQAGAASTSHASTHSDGGSDEVDAGDLASGAATNGQVLTANGTGGAAWQDATGDISGPVTSTDNAAARWDGTGGDTLQDSPLIIGDTGDLSGIGNITLTGTVDGRDVSADGTTLDGHVASTANPHSTDVGNLGSGTLAELNTAITDATLDDSGDPRTPTAHAASHSDGGSDEVTVENLATASTTTTHVLSPDGLGGLVMRAESGGAVSSVFGRTGDVVAATDDYTWAQIDKGLSDIADIVSRSHTDLTDIGTNTHSQIDSHIASSSNPHGVTAAQAGADPAGSASTVQGNLDTHIADTANPHSTDVGNLGSGTLAELNAAITDATLDDSGDPRTPTAHAASHSDGGADEVTVENLATASTTTTHVLSPDGLGGLVMRAESGGGGGDVTAAANIGDHALVRGDGGAKGVQGDASLATMDDSGNITVNSGADTANIFGEAFIGNNGGSYTGYAFFAHKDYVGATNRALAVSPSGGTTYQSAAGQPLQFSIGGTATLTVNTVNSQFFSNVYLAGKKYTGQNNNYAMGDATHVATGVFSAAVQYCTAISSNAAADLDLKYNTTTHFSITAAGVAVAATKTFTLGGVAVDDILTSSDAASAGDDELVTAGYVDAHARGLTLVTLGLEEWNASEVVTTSDYRTPTTPNGFYYECTTGGTTGASEPTWGTTPGGTTSDNTATWTCRRLETGNRYYLELETGVQFTLYDPSGMSDGDQFAIHVSQAEHASNPGGLTLERSSGGILTPWSAAATELLLVASDAVTFTLMDGKLSYEGKLVPILATLQDEKSSGTDAGTATGGAWVTRVLNTTHRDPWGITSLSSNQVTLQPGNYKLQGFAPGFECKQARARLYNATDTSVINDGPAARSDANFNGVVAPVTGDISITAAKAIELRYYPTATQSGNGLGDAVGTGSAEVYAQLIVEMIR